MISILVSLLLSLLLSGIELSNVDVAYENTYDLFNFSFINFIKLQSFPSLPLFSIFSFFKFSGLDFYFVRLFLIFLYIHSICLLFSKTPAFAKKKLIIPFNFLPFTFFVFGFYGLVCYTSGLRMLLVFAFFFYSVYAFLHKTGSLVPFLLLSTLAIITHPSILITYLVCFSEHLYRLINTLYRQVTNFKLNPYFLVWLGVAISAFLFLQSIILSKFFRLLVAQSKFGIDPSSSLLLLYTLLATMIIYRPSLLSVTIALLFLLPILLGFPLGRITWLYLYAAFVAPYVVPSIYLNLKMFPLYYLSLLPIVAYFLIRTCFTISSGFLYVS